LDRCTRNRACADIIEGCRLALLAGREGQSDEDCDCPLCMPRGEVKAKRYRERVYKRIDALGLRD
jgi:hypothetical protein